MRYCSFRAPLQRGSWAAWAGQPQVLSHVAATTCRAWIPTLKARRASPKVARNGGFPAQFEHLYTTLTWPFLGWSSRDIVCCEPSAFILRPSLERQSRCEFSAMEPAMCRMLRYRILHPSSRILAMEPAVCGMFRDPDPSRSGGRGWPGPSARLLCAMMAALELRT